MRVQFGVRLVILALSGICLTASTAEAAGVVAKRGRRYPISKKHGPWMIRVISLKSVGQAQLKQDENRGKAIVHELRLRGIPAYCIVRTVEFQPPITVIVGKKTVRKFNETVVLAGNYESDSTLAEKTLQYVRQFGDT